MNLRNCVLAGAIAASFIGSAGAAEESGFYVGALAGATDFNISRVDSEFTWGLFTGWQFNRNFAAELGYYKPGSLSLSDGTTYSATINSHIIAATLIGSYPLNDKWSIFARAGLDFPQVKAEVEFNGENVSTNDFRTDFLYGGGVALTLKRVQLRLEYQRMNSDPFDGDLLSLGIVFPF